MMDIVAILNLLNQGGPTVLFLILAGLLWMQHITITALKHSHEDLATHFNNFQILYANEKVRRVDLEEIRDLIREHNTSNKELIARVFERLDDHAVRCGKDCLASLHARADLQMATSRQNLAK